MSDWRLVDFIQASIEKRLKPFVGSPEPIIVLLGGRIIYPGNDLHRRARTRAADIAASGFGFRVNPVQVPGPSQSMESAVDDIARALETGPLTEDQVKATALVPEDLKTPPFIPKSMKSLIKDFNGTVLTRCYGCLTPTPDLAPLGVPNFCGSCRKTVGDQS